MSQPHRTPVDVLDSYLRLRETRSRKAASHRYCVAISREFGALGTETAQVPGRSAWLATLRQTAGGSGRRELESAPAIWWREWTTRVVTGWRTCWPCLVGGVDQAAFAVELRNVVAALGREGHAVFLGRGADALLPPTTCLRVRLIAPLEVRVKRIARKLGISTEIATREALAIDKRRREFLRDYYRKEIDDPHNYELTLNTEGLTSSSCADLIFRFARARWPDFPSP